METSPSPFERIVSFIRELYAESYNAIPLHAPVFSGKEKEFLLDCIDSTFVSSVGKYVDQFESMVAEYTGVRYAVAVVNGTAALHLALILAGVEPGDLVITQAVSFIATANAISYCGAEPVFLDSDGKTLGLSAIALEAFLDEKCFVRDGKTYESSTLRRVAACVPMHTLGHPVQLKEILDTCNRFFIPVVEDAAESIGSFYHGAHTGTFGKLGILSFNGNKTITTGGGGMILTDNDVLGKMAKHLSTTAKIPHPWEFVHDHIGFNYRLPNINAALGCAQMELLPEYLEKKRKLAEKYNSFFKTLNIPFMTEPQGCRSNYWLNAILLKDRNDRDAFLEYSNANKAMTRPLWTPLPRLKMFEHCYNDGFPNAQFLEDRIVCIPSSINGYL